MVSDAQSWLPGVLQTVLDAIGISSDVLIAMTMLERAQLWEKYQYGDEVAALAETAVCDAPEELKNHAAIEKMRPSVEAALNATLADDYKPVAVDITVSDVPTTAKGSTGLDDIDEDEPATAVAALPAANTNTSSYNSYTYTPPKRSELEEQYVGILNQGGTCYLNSTVQALFHIPKFREIIYNIKVDDAAGGKEFADITMAFQNLFLALQTKKASISTVELTKSFGWDVRDAHEQHDAHEMIQRLLEAFEMITKGTPVRQVLHDLFYGKQLNYVRCLDTGYVSRNPAEFFDLELLTLNSDGMAQSLDAKVRPEKLDGEYKREYDDGREPTKHPAEMGSVFLSLPPVLFVHPSRVGFCMQTFQRKMVETEWRFDKTVNFSRYVAKDPEEGVAVVNDGSGEDEPSLDYELLSVIMHQGTPFSGHYMAYTRFGDKWLKFNDSTVTEVSEESVLNDGYSVPTTSSDYWGGTTTRPAYTRASVLVYIKSSIRDQLVFPISEADLPASLHDNLRLKAERDEIAKKEAEIKARQVAVRYMVGDCKGDYLTALGALHGRDAPTDSASMDKDVTGAELGARLAEAAGIDFDAIADLWQYPDYFWHSSHYSPKVVSADATAGECAKGWVFIQLKDSAPVVPPAAVEPEAMEGEPAVTAAEEACENVPMVKEDTQVGEDMETPASTTDYVSILDAPLEPAKPKAVPKVTPYSNLPSLLPLCVYRRGALEYVGLCTSTFHLVDTLKGLERSIVPADMYAELRRKKVERDMPPIAVTRRYIPPKDDDLYGEGEKESADGAQDGEEKAQRPEEVALEFEDTFAFCYVEKNVLKNSTLRGISGGCIIVAYPRSLPTHTISNAYDRLCNPLNITIYQLDDALTPEELCDIVVCPSYTYQQLQDAVFEAMEGKTAALRVPIRRMPASRDQIGFRCHDDRTDRPHKTMQLSNKNTYNNDKHTAQSILSNKSNYMITKLYVEVLPEVISVPELDGHGRVCDIPLHLGYFYTRHFYMKEGKSIPLYEVYRVCMAQQLASLPQEFRDRVEERWVRSRDAYLTNKAAVAADEQLDMICKQSTFDPVFRLVRMSYNGTGVHSEHYDWSELVSLDTFYDYVVDLLPVDITKVNWTRYVKVERQEKPIVYAPAVPLHEGGPSTPADEVDAAGEQQAAVQQEVVAPSDEGGAPQAEHENDDAPGAEEQEVVVEEPSGEVKADTDDATAVPLLITEGPTGSSGSEGMQRVESIPGENSVAWYQLFHGDRRYTDAIYGLVSSVVLPVDDTLTGAQILELILKQIGVQPEDGFEAESAGASASPSAVSSPASAGPKPLDAYQSAKATWKVVFKGTTTKVLEPNAPYSKIASDIGTVEYVLLDHPQSTKARVIARNQRAEQAIRIGIITSETDKMRQKHEAATSQPAKE